MSEENRFFDDLGKSIITFPDIGEYCSNAYFIAVNEFHWSQKDIEEAEIPFLLDMLRIREEKKALKKKRM